jgi:hypothetical protein
VLGVEEVPNVRKGFSICTILVMASLLLAAQGHRPPSGSVPGSAHSNAPSGPAAGQDRDTRKDRAEDVGKARKRVWKVTRARSRRVIRSTTRNS